MRTWTDDRIASLETLWSEGKSASEIGRIIGVPKNAVIGKAHRLFLKARRPPLTQPVYDADLLMSLWVDKVPTEEIATEFGVTRSAIYARIGKLGLPGRGLARKGRVDIIEDAELRNLLNLNWSQQEIADIFNVSQSYISTRARLLGFGRKTKQSEASQLESAG